MQDTGPTVQFSSETPEFAALMCNGDVVTWGDMYIWVVTAAGEGLVNYIPGTVITPAC